MWSIFSYAYLSSVYLLWWGIYNGLCPILKSGFLFFLLLNFFQTWFFGEGTKQEDFSNIQHENENATSVFLWINHNLLKKTSFDVAVHVIPDILQMLYRVKITGLQWNQMCISKMSPTMGF